MMNKKIQNPIKNEEPTILVTRIDHIGDTLLTTPAIAAIKNRFPKSRITALANRLAGEVLRGNQSIDELIVYEKPEIYDLLPTHIKTGIEPASGEFYDKIKKRNFDIILNFSAAVKDYIEINRFGGKFKVAPIYKNMIVSRIVGALLLDKGIICDDDPGKYDKDPNSIKLLHEVEQNEKVISFLDVKPVETHLILPLFPEDEEYADDLLYNKLKIKQDKKIIALQISDRWFPEKQRVGGIVELILNLREKFPQYELLCFSYPGIEKLAEEIKKRVSERSKKNKEHKINFLSNLPLKKFAAVLKRCGILITMHSGATHISAAVGLPSVVVFNPGSFDYFSYRECPWKVKFKAVKSEIDKSKADKLSEGEIQKRIERDIKEIIQSANEILK